MLEIVDNVLEIDETEFRQAQLSNGTASNLLEALEILVEEVRTRKHFFGNVIDALYNVIGIGSFGPKTLLWLNTSYYHKVMPRDFFSW